MRLKRAHTVALSTPLLLNDRTIQRHTVVLKRLKPGMTYLYSVGDGSPEGWTEPAEFTTAPGGAVPFAFTYMGDAQNGLDRWGVLLHNAFRARPDAAFYLMAGDLVNRGAERWDWDSFFENSKDVFDRRQLVPVLGNHEYQGGKTRDFIWLSSSCCATGRKPFLRNALTPSNTATPSSSFWTPTSIPRNKAPGSKKSCATPKPPGNS